MQASVRMVTQSHKEASWKSLIKLLIEFNSLFVVWKVKIANKQSFRSRGLQSGIMAGDELSPRPGRFSVSMEVLEPGQGCPGVTVRTGTDCRHLCRQCLGSTKRLNLITIFTLGCLTDHKLIMSLFHASVSLSDKRILACFKGDLQTESYCIRNKASRMDLRRKSHLGCLSTEDSSAIWESWNQKGLLSEIAYTCR